MIFLEDLKVLLWWLIAGVLAVNLMFLCSVLYRRLARQRYFRAKDAAAEGYRRVVDETLAGRVDLEQAARALGQARTRAERAAAEQELLARQGEAPADITHLLFALGHVERWSRAAFGYFRGRRVAGQALRGEHAPLPLPAWHTHLPSLRALKLLSVPRALAVERLGRLESRMARVFLAEALRDPAAEVRQMAVALLGRGRDPRALPLLLEEMRNAVEQGSDISLRTAKGALAAYQMEDLRHFLPLLGHANPRMRFFVVDTIREICNQEAEERALGHEDFPPALYQALLGCARDRSADVRARAAGVIRYFRDTRALEALRRLLCDQSEFVRLHAVRAASDPFYEDLRSDLCSRLGDQRWRVREAAARALMVHGGGGRRRLYRQFVTSGDRYASEQMADEMQRAGAVDDLVAEVAAPGDEAALGQAVVRKLAAIGKTALLRRAVLSSGVPEGARIALLEALMVRPGEETVAALQFLAEQESGAVRQKALALLRRSAGRAGPSSAAVALTAEKDSAD